MNGIIALYKAMKDPELETSWGTKNFWGTFKEISDGFPNITKHDIFSNDWEIRKKESNLDKAIEEIKNKIKRKGWVLTNVELEEMLSKYIKD